MAISIDATSSSYRSGGSGSPFTWSHTVGGGENRGLIVGAVINGWAGSIPSNCTATYNGVAMTKHMEQSYYFGDNGIVVLFSMAAPNIGTNTVQLNWSGGNATLRTQAISIYDMRQDNWYYTVLTKSATAASYTESVEALAGSGGIVFDCANVNTTAGTNTPGSNQTELIDSAGGTGTCLIMSYKTLIVTNPISMSYTFSGSVSYRLGVLSIRSTFEQTGGPAIAPSLIF
jgi:hypothetical protein